MKKIGVLLLMFSLIQGCAALGQFNVDVNKSKKFPPSAEMKIGVLTFIAPTAGSVKYSTLGPEGTSTTPENAGSAVADVVSSELMKIPNVVVIERSQLEKLLTEHKLSLSGVIKDPDFTVLGKILPVDALVVGNVTNFIYFHESLSWGATVAYTARLVNIQTGEVLFTLNCSASQFNALAEKLAHELAKETVRKALEK